MRASEFITEAHHSRMLTWKLGTWTVHIDSHAFVSLPERDIALHDFVNILTFACKYVPELKDIPRGKGAYFQDTNTLVSLYLRRSQHYPSEITVETALGPNMKPKPPLFRRSVPPPDYQDTDDMKRTAVSMRDRTMTHGRDKVSQDIEDLIPTIEKHLAAHEYTPDMPSPSPSMPALNRADRRTLQKYLRKQK